jgi:hypothetical protein
VSDKKEGFDLIKYEYDFSLTPEQDLENWEKKYKEMYGHKCKELGFDLIDFKYDPNLTLEENMEIFKKKREEIYGPIEDGEK